MTPLANPLPIWGSPPVYQPERWNTNPKLLNTNNCMSYAFNRPMGSNGHYRSNGFRSRTEQSISICQSRHVTLSTAMQKANRGEKDLDEKGCCSKGYHKVALVLSPSVDYHGTAKTRTQPQDSQAVGRVSLEAES